MKNFIYLFTIILFLLSCKKSSDTLTPTQETEINPPISTTPIIKDFVAYPADPNNTAFLTADNNIFICGSDSPNTCNGKLNAIKITKNGTVIWNKRFKIDTISYAKSATELNGFYYILGKSWLPDPIGTREVIIKLNPQGELVWKKIYTINDQNGGNSRITKSKDNTLVIAGQYGRYGVRSHIYAMKIDEAGTVLWSNKYDTGIPFADESPQSITESSNGNYLITGRYTDNNISEGIYYLRINSSGAKIWDKKFAQKRYHYASIELPDGSILSTGYKDGVIFGWPQAYLLKLDKTGNVVFDKDYGKDSLSDLGHSIKLNKNNTVSICGFSNDRFYIVNVDLDGNKLWEKRFGTTYYNFVTIIGDQLDNNLIFGYTTVPMQLKPLPAQPDYISTIHYSRVDKDGNYY